MDQADNRPMLKITGLHIRGLKSIEALDLPADGLFWEGQMPSFMVIGGVNGSGKTTLLNLIYEALSAFATNTPTPGPAIGDWWIDFALSDGEFSTTFRLLGGTESFIEKNATASYATWSNNGIALFIGSGKAISQLLKRLRVPGSFFRSALPSVVYLPTDRILAIPPSEFKRAGKLPRADRFANKWEHPGNDWGRSLEGRLYSARWADLNAKEKGHPQEAVHFAAYADAFRELTEGSRTLDWTVEGDLVAVAKDGVEHDLTGLSAGEQQALLLTAELLLRWRPGSLILIDEPELHLHTHWQAKLLTMLERFLEQRGGQIIVTTQSTDLWKMAPAKGGVLLGRTSL